MSHGYFILLVYNLVLFLFNLLLKIVLALAIGNSDFGFCVLQCASIFSKKSVFLLSDTSQDAPALGLESVTSARSPPFLKIWVPGVLITTSDSPRLLEAHS